MLVLLVSFLVNSNHCWFPFTFIFDILNDGLFVFTLVLCGAQCLLAVSGSSKESVCVVLLFYSQTESLHNTAEMVGTRVGLIGMKKGVLFWFLLYVTNIIVLLKKQDFFSNTLGNCLFIPTISSSGLARSEDYRKQFYG